MAERHRFCKTKPATTPEERKAFETKAMVISMELYIYDSFIKRLAETTYAIGAIVLGSLAVGLIIYLCIQLIKSKKEKGRFPMIVIGLYFLIVAIPTVASIGLGNMFIKSAMYNRDMKNGDAQFLVGDVEVISCVEEEYRLEPTGNYIVEIKVGEEIIKPSNGFPKTVIEYFDGDKELIIQYGIIEGDGLYVWNIKLSE